MSMIGTESEANSSKVFICNSEGASKHHLTEDCRGLITCKHTIIEISVQEVYNKDKKHFVAVRIQGDKLLNSY